MKARNRILLSLGLISVFLFVPANSSSFTTYPDLLYSPKLVLGSYDWQVVNFTLNSISNLSNNYDLVTATVSLNSPYGTETLQLSSNTNITVQIIKSIANKSLSISEFPTYFNLTLSHGNINMDNLILLIEREYDNTIKDYGNGTTEIIKSQNNFDWLNQTIPTLTYYQNYTTWTTGNIFVINVNQGKFNQTEYYEKDTGLLDRLSLTDANENLTLALTSKATQPTSINVSSGQSSTSTSTSQLSSSSGPSTTTAGIDFTPLVVVSLAVVTLFKKKKL